ncbi:MAG TPA: mandelate racemase/muconate lactonizing enzyme family protein [Chloroflexota bacterium]|nr:mandelate racemase/muconate lactonizing enzyme family protein [Chloroflexota bacterium]
MRIDAVRSWIVTMGRTDPSWKTAAYAATSVDACIVEVRADGLTGLGGAAGRPPGRGIQASRILADLHGPAANALIGEDALARTDLVERLRRAGLHQSAISAVDMALYDLLGKAAGLSLHRLWGGAQLRSIPVVRMIGIKPPRDLVAAAEDLVESGFAHFKVKVGTGVSEDVARIRALRSELGDNLWIGVDANGAYCPDEALDLCRALAPFDVRLLEQPVDYADIAGLAMVTKGSPIPIMADQIITSVESALRVCQAGAAHVVSLKVGQAGTLDQCRRIAELCLAFGVGVHIGGSARPAVVDAAHALIAAALPGVSPECEIGESLAVTGDATGPPPIRDGHWLVGDSPGLGIALRPPTGEETA